MKRAVFALAGALVLAGCLGSVDPVPDRRYGFIILDTHVIGADTVTDPIGIFYRSQPLNIPDTLARDFCYQGVVDSAAVAINPSLDHLDAGDYITMHLSGVVDDLIPVEYMDADVYRLQTPASFSPGDSVLLESPGGPDFPAFSIHAKTAEPFTMEPVGLSAQGANLQLLWSPPAGPGSKMIVSLRWKDEEDSVVVRQLYCDLVDDGAFSVPSPQLIDWRLAATRQVVATRERTRTPSVTGVTLRAISNYEMQVPVAQ